MKIGNDPILLVYGPLNLGGIETLIVRLAEELVARGRTVTVAAVEGELLGSLPEAAGRIIYRTRSELLSSVKASRESFARTGTLIMISFDPISCALGLAVECALPRIEHRHITGVFHPRAYFMTGEDWIRLTINSLVFRVMKDHQFFINQETRQGQETLFDADLSSNPIIPLGITSRPIRKAPESSDTLRVVSVGRLTDFKAYNWGAAAIVRALREKGIAVEWDIFGDGECSGRTAAAIAEMGVSETVRLKGSLPYARFDEVVGRYDVFVGVGTAALEAAMIGIPVIAAVDSEPLLTYGFLQDLPYGNQGERQAQPPARSIEQMLEQLAGADADRRRQLGELARQAAIPYDMAHYADALLRFAGSRPGGKRLRKCLVSTIYHQLTLGLTRRIGNRIVRQVRRLR